MTDREKLLTALVQESERRSERVVRCKVSPLDVVAMLERLGAEHERVVHHKAVRTAA